MKIKPHSVELLGRTYEAPKDKISNEFTREYVVDDKYYRRDLDPGAIPANKKYLFFNNSKSQLGSVFQTNMDFPGALSQDHIGFILGVATSWVPALTPDALDIMVKANFIFRVKKDGKEEFSCFLTDIPDLVSFNGSKGAFVPNSAAETAAAPLAAPRYLEWAEDGDNSLSLPSAFAGKQKGNYLELGDTRAIVLGANEPFEVELEAENTTILAQLPPGASVTDCYGYDRIDTRNVPLQQLYLHLLGVYTKTPKIRVA